MNTTFFQSFDVVTVAVAFDDHTVALVEAGAALARKAGKKLCLLHLVEPWAELPRSVAFAERSPLWDVTLAVESDTRGLALAKLEELSAMLAPELSVSAVVAFGKPAVRLGAEAQAVGSCLLLVGTDLGSLRLLSRGFSTAWSLMVTSPVPVLVIDTSSPELRLNAEHPRILLADDLSDASEAAVACAFDLAAACGSELHHMHVNGLSLAALEAGLATAGAASHAVLSAGETAGDLHGILMARLEEQLLARAEDAREYLEAANGSYESDVRSGSVQDQLAEAIAASDPDILVFGRSSASKDASSFFGRTPLHALMGHRRPILVVPGV